MGLNLPEWANAQTLLTTLAEALTPFTNEKDPLNRLGRQVNPLSKRLFVPPSADDPSFPFPVTLLKALTSTQEQMKGLLPEEENSPKSENPSSQNINPKESSRIQKKQSIQGKTDRSERSFVANRTGVVSSFSRPHPTSFSERGPLWGKAAQQVLVEVKQALELITAAAQAGPAKGEPLRDAMRKLKPMIDQLIDQISRGETASDHEGLPPPMPPVQAKSTREPPSKREIPFPHFKKENSSERMNSEVRKTEKRFSRSDGEKEIGDSKERIEKREFQKKMDSEEGSRGKEKVLSTSDPSSSSDSSESPSPLMHKDQQSDRPNVEIRPYERTSLPGAPFTPGIVSSSPEKKKKKKKRFWSLKEEEEERSS